MSTLKVLLDIVRTRAEDGAPETGPFCYRPQGAGRTLPQAVRRPAIR
nr:MAG TPA: hypothetical protein [Caudoviricetes sp.]